jgi:hypothetical protein
MTLLAARDAGTALMSWDDGAGVVLTAVPVRPPCGQGALADTAKPVQGLGLVGAALRPGGSRRSPARLGGAVRPANEQPFLSKRMNGGRERDELPEADVRRGRAP